MEQNFGDEVGDQGSGARISGNRVLGSRFSRGQVLEGPLREEDGKGETLAVGQSWFEHSVTASIP